VATGSGDHGIRVYNVDSGVFSRELYSKKYGHHEWVTSLSYLNNGRLLSGGMDNLLCLWDAKGVRCDFLKGHDGSISKVMTDDYNVGVSSSYDTTMMIWDLDTKKSATRLMGVHKEPVLDFDWHNSLLVSGDKNGYIVMWDVNEAKPIKVRKCHQGGVSQIILHSDSLKHHLIFTAGINDGTLCAHDMRTNDIVYSQQLHKGAINAVKVNLSNMITTASADKNIKLVDIVSGFKTYGTMAGTDAVFCLENIHNITLAGSGDGNLLAYDNDTCECLYGYGVMQKGAVRCIKIAEDKTKLVAAGDDPTPLLLYYI